MLWYVRHRVNKGLASPPAYYAHLRTRLPSVPNFYSFFSIAVSSGLESDVVNGCGNSREATLLPVAPFPPSASGALPIRLIEFRT